MWEFPLNFKWYENPIAAKCMRAAVLWSPTWSSSFSWPFSGCSTPVSFEYHDPVLNLEYVECFSLLSFTPSFLQNIHQGFNGLQILKKCKFFFIFTTISFTFLLSREKNMILTKILCTARNIHTFFLQFFDQKIHTDFFFTKIVISSRRHNMRDWRIAEKKWKIVINLVFFFVTSTHSISNDWHSYWEWKIIN